jgi:hypothetical protein
MIKYDTTPITLEYQTSRDLAVESAHRLIVLVPAGLDASLVARRLRELEQTTGMPVLLLSICKERADEPALRRELVTLASLLKDGRHSLELEVEPGTDWMKVVRNHYEVGDMLVCFDGQQTGLLQKPLSQLLESNFKADVYVLPGLDLQEAEANALSQVVAWLGFLVIILGFGLLQVKIVQASDNWLQNILLILSILPEFWLLHYWAGRPG